MRQKPLQGNLSSNFQTTYIKLEGKTYNLIVKRRRGGWGSLTFVGASWKQKEKTPDRTPDTVQVTGPSPECLIDQFDFVSLSLHQLNNSHSFPKINNINYQKLDVNFIFYVFIYKEKKRKTFPTHFKSKTFQQSKLTRDTHTYTHIHQTPNTISYILIHYTFYPSKSQIKYNKLGVFCINKTVDRKEHCTTTLKRT